MIAPDLEARFGTVERRAERPGGRELPLVAPADEAELAEVLAFARVEGLAVVPVGLGSKASWCAPAERADLLVSTRRLAGVVDHEPGDGTLTARAGTDMATLAEAAAAGGHALTPDVPRPAGSTLGGVVAAGQSGFDRLLHGPVRHHVLGMRVMTADGRATKTGGKLVKNVTGYDLHRLYTGSHGTLCVVLEVSLRLFPLPESEVVLALDVPGLAEGLEAARRAIASAVPCTAVCVEAAGGGAGRVTACLGGRAAPVAHEADELALALPGAARREGDEASVARRALRDRELEDGRWSELVVQCRGAALEAVARAALDAARRSGLDVAARAHPGIAELALRCASPPAPAALRAVAGAAAEAGGRVRWLGALHAEGVDRFGPPSPGLPLMRALRSALDPDGVLARGRFHGGL